MGEAKRRKAQVAELKMIPLSELTSYLCAWDGCGAVFKEEEGFPPKGWASLLMFATSKPIQHLADIPASDWLRDTFLCPRHVGDLQRQLRTLPTTQLLRQEPEGNA